MGISNEPTMEHIANLRRIAQKVFQPARDFFGVPIRVSSGYRSPELNKAIGGSTRSQHSKGEALDLIIEGRNMELFFYIKNHLEFDQLIWEFGTDTEPDWVHVSYSEGKNRGEVLVAEKINGKTSYRKFN